MFPSFFRFHFSVLLSVQAFALMGKRLTNEEADILFKKYHVDGTGEISIDEFSNMVREILKQGCKVICVYV
jgi:Ca2+-binding EF-hand superfamily protein